MDCKRLVAIHPKSKFEGGPLDYVPFPHEEPAQHKGCGGLVKQVDDGPMGFKCFKCLGDVFEDEVERPSCDGHKRPIR